MRPCNGFSFCRLFQQVWTTHYILHTTLDRKNNCGRHATSRVAPDLTQWEGWSIYLDCFHQRLHQMHHLHKDYLSTLPYVKYSVVRYYEKARSIIVRVTRCNWVVSWRRLDLPFSCQHLELLIDTKYPIINCPWPRRPRRMLIICLTECGFIL